MLEYNPETHVAVPKSELAKLEQARINLFHVLTPILGEWDLNLVTCHTQQIWNVANRLKWEN